AQIEFSLEDTVLEVKLNDLLIVGDNIEIEISFNGKVPLDFAEGSIGIYNLSDNTMTLAGWFPILAVFDDEGWNLDPVSSIGDNVYSDMAFYSVELIASDDLKVPTTGCLKDNQIPYSFVSGPSRDFIMVLGYDFEVISQEIQGTKINTYYLPDHKDAADITLVIAADSLKTFNSKFGSYPYTELDIVDVPMSDYIGVEFPGIIVNSSLIYGDALYTSHEIAHQWWYNVIGSDVVDNPWLDEALAMYSSLIYFEDNSTDEEYQELFDYFQMEYQNTINLGEDDIITESLEHFEELGSEHYSTIVYIKGALFFHSLREQIGDNAFFEALQEYYELKKYQIATPEDLLNSFEKSSGEQLDYIYQEWLYKKQESSK
ncbi:M1 family metallopeptidase, partial [Actinomycetota bacterium]